MMLEDMDASKEAIEEEKGASVAIIWAKARKAVSVSRVSM